jgi:chemotaxis response regulator CheB
MEKQSVRVVLASEYPQMRHFLSRVIERENGVDVVAEAPDTTKALTLVRNLRPDVAVIDSALPHVVGLEAIPLSRISGLDTAQAISQETTDTRVILLNNLDTGVLADPSVSSRAAARFAIESMGTDISLAPSDLRRDLTEPNALVFARVEMKQTVALQQKITSTSDKVIFFGGLGVAGGWLLTLTMFLAPVGIPLAIAGGITVFLGIAGKLTASLWRRTQRGTKRG